MNYFFHGNESKTADSYDLVAVLRNQELSKRIYLIDQQKEMGIFPVCSQA